MRDKMNILIVVTNYRSEAVISSRRWRYLAEYLAGRGYQITVISHDGTAQDVEININGINIFTLAQNLTKVQTNSNRVSKLKKYKDKLAVPLAIYYGISEWRMGVKLKREIQCLCKNKALKNKHFDVVISSVYNMDAFFIAKELRKNFEIKKHICDIRDPLVNPFFGNKAQRWLGIRRIKMINQEVDAFTTVEGLIKNEICTVIKRGRKPVYIIPHAYREFLNHRDRECREGKVELCLAYIGTYYPNNHDASPIVYAIKELDKKKKINTKTVKIVVAGKNSQLLKQYFEENGVGAYVENRDYVLHDEAVELQKQADILLFLSAIDEVSEHQGVSGKFAEYISLDKELLMLFDVRNHAEEQLNYFIEMKIGLTLNTKDADAASCIEGWIESKIEEKNNGEILHNPNMELVKKYSLSYVGHQVEKVLYKVCL